MRNKDSAVGPEDGLGFELTSFIYGFIYGHMHAYERHSDGEEHTQRDTHPFQLLFTSKCVQQLRLDQAEDRHLVCQRPKILVIICFHLRHISSRLN